MGRRQLGRHVTVNLGPYVRCPPSACCHLTLLRQRPLVARYASSCNISPVARSFVVARSSLNNNMLSNIIRRQAQTCKLGGPLCRTAFSASRSLSSRAVAFQKPAQAITARFAQFSTSLPSQDLSSVPSAGVSSLTARTLFIGNLPRRYRSDALKSELEKRGGAVAHLKLRE